MIYKKISWLSVFFIASCSMGTSSIPADDFVSVYISTGQTQCNDDGKTLTESSALLTSVNIVVKSSQCGFTTGMVYPSMCGAGTNKIYIHSIASTDLQAAEKLGFLAVPSNDSSLGYQIADCP